MNIEPHLPADVKMRPANGPIRVNRPVIRVDVSGLSHTGRVRPNNEDHFLIARLGRYLETVATSLPAGELPQRADEDSYVMIVADGMGGHAGGELASRTTIRELVQMALDLPDWIVRIEDSTKLAAEQRSKGRIRAINKQLLEQSRRDPNLRGMGSTLTIARNLGNVLQIAHVGDSRAYLLRDGQLHRLTRDHTYVQMLVDRGQLTAEEAAVSTARHVLTNAVGGFSDEVQVDIDRAELKSGDRILLCSDGLTDLLDDEAILGALKAHASAAAACQNLIDLALAAGGKDNVTAIVAGFTFEAA